MWFWILGTLVAAAALIAMVGYFLFMRFRAPGGRTGRIEGVLLIDGKPAPANTPVACHLSECEPPDDVECTFSILNWSVYALTDDRGRFTFARVPEGDVGLGRAYGNFSRETRLFGSAVVSDDIDSNDHELTVVVRANETTNVTLGVPATRLRGQFIDAEHATRAFEGLHVECAFMSRRHEDSAVTDDDSPDEYDAWRPESLKSEESLQWRNRVWQMYQVFVDGHGALEIPNVRPGRYNLHVQLNDSPCGDGDSARPFGDFKGIIEVPGNEEIPVAAELDLGELPLQIYTPLKPGDPLPNVAVRDHNGKPLEFRCHPERWFLFCLWRPGNDIWGTISMALDALEERREIRDRLDVLAVSMEEDWGPAQRLLRGISPPWPLKLVLDEDDLALSTAFGVRKSAFFLFAPDGKLVQGEIPPEALMDFLRRAIENAA